MRTIAAALISGFATTAALAQSPSPAPKPKPVPTVAVRPDGSIGPRPGAAATATANPATAQATAERTALQSDLAWVGAYNGLINGEASERLVAAIKSFQKDNGGKPTGTLTPQERSALAAAARALQANAGWKIGLDPINGIKLGLPTKFASIQSNGATGSKWSSAQGQIQIETWRLKDSGLTIAAVADRERKQPAGRKVEYSVVKPDFFVLSGLQGLKRFYVKGQIKGGEVRGFTVLYDQATDGTMAPVVVAMASAFAPFDGGAAVAPPAPPPRKKVEYATGVVVDRGGVIATDAYAVAGCNVIVAAGLGNADRLRDDSSIKAGDKAGEVALLRLYGTSPLIAATLAPGAARGDVTIAGIADPESQGGRDAVSTVNGKLAAAGDEMRLDPAPGLGFDGAAVSDADGRLLGLVKLRLDMVAGPAAGAARATLIDADAVRARLAAAGMTPAASAAGRADPKASVVRLICVRK